MAVFFLIIWDLETHLWALPHSGVIKALQALHWLHKLSRFSGVGVRASSQKQKGTEVLEKSESLA